MSYVCPKHGGTLLVLVFLMVSVAALGSTVSKSEPRSSAAADCVVDFAQRTVADHVAMVQQLLIKAMQPPRTVASCGVGERVPTLLSQYLRLVRQVAPYAQVTGTFDDFRPPSYLRAEGGKHNGYDIGLDSGTGVPCGWKGRVLRVTHWGARQCGIAVDIGGVIVTYGHLAPRVKVGQRLAVGDLVGIVCNDHVDVKMHDASGFVDFGRWNPLAERPPSPLARKNEPGSHSALD